MNSGKLRQIITIQQPVRTVSEDGDPVVDWQTFEEVFADVRDVAGREYYGHAKINSDITHVVYIRWLNGVGSDFRILFGTRILNIKYPPAEDYTHARMMTIFCAEGGE